jgi:hypothetical protein
MKTLLAKAATSLSFGGSMNVFSLPGVSHAARHYADKYAPVFSVRGSGANDVLNMGGVQIARGMFASDTPLERLRSTLAIQGHYSNLLHSDEAVRQDSFAVLEKVGHGDQAIQKLQKIAVESFNEHIRWDAMEVLAKRDFTGFFEFFLTLKEEETPFEILQEAAMIIDDYLSCCPIAELDRYLFKNKGGPAAEVKTDEGRVRVRFLWCNEIASVLGTGLASSRRMSLYYLAKYESHLPDTDLSLQERRRAKFEFGNEYRKSRYGAVVTVDKQTNKELQQDLLDDLLATEGRNHKKKKAAGYLGFCASFNRGLAVFIDAMNDPEFPVETREVLIELMIAHRMSFGAGIKADNIENVCWDNVIINGYEAGYLLLNAPVEKLAEVIPNLRLVSFKGDLSEADEARLNTLLENPGLPEGLRDDINNKLVNPS